MMPRINLRFCPLAFMIINVQKSLIITKINIIISTIYHRLILIFTII